MRESLTYETGLREECGVFGMFDLEGGDVARDMYYGLSALQHRGQESCGIAVCDTNGPKGVVNCYKGLGLVNEVFHEETLKRLGGNLGVGHVRYSTTGSSTIENTQPLVLKYFKGTLCLAHNGNLVNAFEMRRQLEETGAIFQTTMDSEVIAFHIARERLAAPTAEEAIKRTAAKTRGAYALIISSPRKLIGVRDPFGLRPLCLGKKGNVWIMASESCAITSVGGEFIRDIEPGEIVTITRDGVFSDKSLQQEKRAHCVFEYIYFARLDSHIDDVSVYEARLRGGAALAHSFPADADLVAGVPDSGLTAAMGYAKASGIPYEIIFHKNSYVGRTFIKPQQSQRESSVRVKLNVLKEAVKGKRIIMIDDSIVRGTTSDRIVGMLREAGAKEVHVRISSPPFLYPCYFGTDIPDREQLIAYNRSVDEICKIIGADSLAYLRKERLVEISGGRQYCHGCFTGEYPMEPPKEDIRGEHENFKRGEDSKVK